MILQQFYLGCLAHASYLIADESTKTAWIIDPQRDVGIYREAAKKLGVTITDVALTHIHADFVAGHLALRDQVGATIHVGARAQVGYATVPATDGAEYRLGAVRIVAWETPGHTPEGITWLIYDDSVAKDRPQAALTGDTLFIGDVGRPDLLASAGMKAEDLAGMLYDSVQRLLTLPDATTVYPAHGAGSLCGKNLSKDTVSSIGRERLSNYALQPMTKADFILRVTEEQPPAPAYFAHDVAMNKADHTTQTQPVTALSWLVVEASLATGVQLLDARDGNAFAAAHVRGAINVGIDGQFAMWVGAVLNPKLPVIIIADAARVDEVVLRLRRVGCDQVVGFITMTEAIPADRITTLRRYEADDVRAVLANAKPPLLVDVRNPGEFAEGHLPEAVNIPLPTLNAAVATMARDREVIVHCAGGYRSVIAASVLAAHDLTVADVIGGYKALVHESPSAVASGTACSLPLRK